MVNTTTNGTAATEKKTGTNGKPAAQGGKSVSELPAIVPAPQEQTKSDPPAKLEAVKPPLQEIFKRTFEIQKQGDVREALVEIQDNANNFVSTENAPGVITFDDMQGNSFKVRNFAVMQRLLALAKETLAEEISKVDAVIIALY